MVFVSKPLLWGAVLAGAAAAWMGVPLLWNLSGAIDGVFLKGHSASQLHSLLLWAAAFAVLRAVFAMGSSHLALRLAESSKSKLRQHLLQMSLQRPSKSQGGESTTHWMRGVESLDAWFGQYLPQVYLTMMVPTALLGIAFWLDPLTGLVFLISAPLLPLFLALIGLTARKKTQEQWKLLAKQGNMYLETLQGLKTLKLFGRSKDWGVELMESARVLRDATLGVLRLAFLSAFVLEMVGTLGTAILAVEIGLRLLYGHMEYREALFLLMLAPEFYLPLRTLGLRAHAAMEGGAAAEGIFSSLQGSSDLPPVSTHEGGPILRIEGLEAGWDAAREPVLNDVSWIVDVSGKYAIAGASGCGKSTLFAVLTAALAPRKGVVSWQQMMRLAWVPQRVRLFQRSLRDNMSLLPQANHAEDAHLWHALGRVGLADFVAHLPAGLDTFAGEEGARLSGGQQRRLALARAFAARADWILLDEPEAHLDQESLVALRQAIFEGPEGILLVSHSPETLSKCTQVLYLEKGRLVDVATHAQLLERYASYRQLMEGQA